MLKRSSERRDIHDLGTDRRLKGIVCIVRVLEGQRPCSRLGRGWSDPRLGRSLGQRQHQRAEAAGPRKSMTRVCALARIATRALGAAVLG